MMTSRISTHTINLISGCKMPLLGLGTFQMKEYDVLHKAINAALAAGYRSFDTASSYRNETDIGKVLKDLLPKFNLRREDIFITSKLAPSEQGEGKAMAAFQNSLDRLDCGYLDLYLIHWPGTQKLKPTDPTQKTLRKQSWLELEKAVKEGKCKSIGVSNYITSHLEELLSYATVQPSVLQTEYHPHLIQRQVKQFCDDHSIHLQAYSSLGTSGTDNKLLPDPTVKSVADEIGKTSAQVLLRWAVQQNVGVIPKSSNPDHIAGNTEIFSFSLDESQMKTLNDLDTQTHYCWDPTNIA